MGGNQIPIALLPFQHIYILRERLLSGFSGSDWQFVVNHSAVRLREIIEKREIIMKTQPCLFSFVFPWQEATFPFQTLSSNNSLHKYKITTPTHGNILLTYSCKLGVVILEFLESLCAFIGHLQQLRMNFANSF